MLAIRETGREGDPSVGANTKSYASRSRAPAEPEQIGFEESMLFYPGKKHAFRMTSNPNPKWGWGLGTGVGWNVRPLVRKYKKFIGYMI